MTLHQPGLFSGISFNRETVAQSQSLNGFQNLIMVTKYFETLQKNTYSE